ncbi:hypothetical protein ACU4GI_12265 [Cupriavidus basilensis]
MKNGAFLPPGCCFAKNLWITRAIINFGIKIINLRHCGETLTIDIGASRD